MELRTTRLLLRQLRDSDLESLVDMGQDPIVMKYFVSLMTREDTLAMYARIQDHWIKNGYGVFAVEVPGETVFAGFIGFTTPRFEADSPEILSRFIPAVHNKGYATEAACAVIDWGFNQLDMTEIIAFVVPQNLASIRVLQKAGLRRAGEFDHPMVPEGHPLQRHLIYKINASHANGLK